jgi:hypothetical protein
MAARSRSAELQLHAGLLAAGLAGIALGPGHHPGAVMRNGFEPALRHQLAQGLTNRRAAHPELASHAGLADVIVRPVMPVEDALLDGLMNLGGGRSRDRRGIEMTDLVHGVNLIVVCNI